ncbi:MAG: OmpW family outer membrane protein [Pseudomonadota bacterium]
MKYLLTTTLICCALLSQPTLADTGDWLVRVGANYVDPKSDNHSIVEVQGNAMVTFNATYFVTPNWAVELLAALPFEHDIDLVSGPQVAKTKHLPPTLSAQYHFMPDAAVRPYIGAGINYTLFFEESTRGALDGSSLELEDSVGLAAQLGVDIDLADRWFLNASVRWMDIDTRAKLDGVSLGDVEIDPWTYGINLGYRL